MGRGDVTLLDITNDIQKILKLDREKCPFHKEGEKIRITADFLSETMEVKRQGGR